MGGDLQPPQRMPTVSYLELVSSVAAILVFGTFAGIMLAALALSIYTVFVGHDVMSSVIASISSQTPDKSGMVANITYVITALIYAAIFVTMWVVAKFGVGVPLKLRVAFNDWNGDRRFWWLALAVAPLFNLVSSVALGALAPDSGNMPPTPTDPAQWFLLFAVAVVIGPICEEMLFRGWLFTALRTRQPFGNAAWITAALFAVMHIGYGALYALLIFPVGLVLAFARERYGSIKPTIVIHGLFNATALILAFITAKP